MFKLLLALVTAAGLALFATPELASAQSSKPDAVELRHGSVTANGVLFHYVAAGRGDPVILLNGWPESWYAWRHVIPQLVRAGRRVYALEPRGFGDSAKPTGGYDPITAGKDIHAAIEALGISGPVDIVAHDVGTWIAYAHATAFPADVRRLVVSEASIPGVSPSPPGAPSPSVNVKTWQFSFNRLEDLPEILVQGRERAFIDWLFTNKSMRPWAISRAELDEYARVFAGPGAARAGFAYYRGFFDEASLSAAKAASSRRLPMPVLALGGEGGVGSALFETLQPLGDRVGVGILQGCGHFLADECPDEFVNLILEFWRLPERDQAAEKR